MVTKCLPHDYGNNKQASSLDVARSSSDHAYLYLKVLGRAILTLHHQLEEEEAFCE